MAKGHAIPLLHLARLLPDRRLASTVTFFTTPRNAPFIRASLAGAGAAVVELPFPYEDGPQSMAELPSSTHLVDFVSAVEALQPAFAKALARIEPRPDLLVHDGFLRWAKDVADELGMPRLVTLGFGGFATYICRAVTAHRPHARVSSPSEPFSVHSLPDLRLTKADLSTPFDAPEPSGPHWDFICKNRISMYSSRGASSSTPSTSSSRSTSTCGTGSSTSRSGQSDRSASRPPTRQSRAKTTVTSPTGWTRGSPWTGRSSTSHSAEQKLNAKFVVDVIQVGLRVRPKEDKGKEGGGLVESGDVQVLARELIHGEEGRRAATRASELSLSSRKSMEVGGSSFENLARMVQEVSETCHVSE